MSRVAKKLINMPKGVELKEADNVLSVKGPKGTLNLTKPAGVIVKNDNGVIQLEVADQSDWSPL